MKYTSVRHMQVCNRFNEPEILTNPEKYFGPNYKILINYWIYKNDVYPEQLRLLNDDKFYNAMRLARRASESVVGITMARYFCFDENEIVAAHLLETLVLIPNFVWV
jgi:hypothetical protein